MNYCRKRQARQFETGIAHFGRETADGILGTNHPNLLRISRKLRTAGPGPDARPLPGSGGGCGCYGRTLGGGGTTTFSAASTQSASSSQALQLLCAGAEIP